VQAARGLEAVHAAGLVHRDFKPENALVGRDDRVRVVDFGLARGDIEGPREIAGTPRYMAPEQAAGEPPTPAVDQFALCVALREALTSRGEGTPDLPRHLARALARGTSPDPAARFPSMRALITALESDPVRRRRRLAIAGGALVAVASAAFFIGAQTEESPCSGPPPGTLDTAARGRALQHVATLGAFATSALPGLTKRLDDAEAAWRREHHSACLAHARGSLTTTLYDRRLTCLARVAATLDTASELLANATPASFPDAEVAADAIVPAASCARVDRSLLPPPPANAEVAVRDATATIERARLFATAMHADAITHAVEARTAAEHTKYAPVIARALLVEGRARMNLDDGDAAAVLEHAGRAALAAGDDATAVEAYARHAYVIATTTGHAPEGLAFVDALGERLDVHDFARLLWLNNRATVYLATNDPKSARAVLDRAYARWRPDEGEDSSELVSILANSALVSERMASGRVMMERAHDEFVRRLGADHPQTLRLAISTAMFIGDLAQARARHDAACDRLGELFPHLAAERADCAYEALWLADEANDTSAITRYALIAARDAKTEPVRAAIATALAREPTPVAARMLEAAAREAAANEAPWMQLAAADAYIAAARIHARTNVPAETNATATDADRAWAAALALLERDGHVFSARRLARVRSALARVRHDRVLATAALAWYRDAGAPEPTIADLAALAAENR
jgi:hypothetical protein